MVFHSHVVLRCWPGRVIIPLFFTRLIKDTACASGYFSFFIVSGMEKNRIGLEMERNKRVWKPEPILWDLSSNHKVSPNLYDHLYPSLSTSTAELNMSRNELMSLALAYIYRCKKYKCTQTQCPGYRSTGARKLGLKLSLPLMDPHDGCLRLSSAFLICFSPLLLPVRMGYPTTHGCSAPFRLAGHSTASRGRSP